MKFYRTLILSGLLAIGANAALAGDGRENQAIRDDLRGSTPGLLEGRSATHKSYSSASSVKDPIQFDLATQGDSD